jgi:hypothetical protein
MLSEKAEHIKRMLEQDKTWNAIMKDLHVGPHTIKKVQEAIIRSKVFEMLERNYTLAQICSKLDVPSANVKKYQLEYLELKGQHEIVCLLKDKDISNLIPIAREIKARNLTPEQIEIGLKLSISVRQLENKRREVSDSISLERKKYAQLCEERSTTEDQIDKLMKQKGRLLENTELLQARLTVFRLAIEKLRNSKDITNLQEIVKNIATSLLDDNKILLAVASSAICRTIAANPQCMTLFSDPAATETLAFFFLDPGSPGNEIWISKTANSIIEANIVILMNGILLGTINALGDKKFETYFEKVQAEMAQFMILRKHHPLISRMFEN